MICTDCQHRDVCDFAGKDSPILTYCCDRESGSWWFDRLRLERMTADRDALRAELDGVRQANRVLDSAAKDAQSWAYQLQQCRAELDRTKGELAKGWISTSDHLPEDGQNVAFITKCDRDPFYHGRVLGGRFTAGEFGGFSVPGLMTEASHWLALPPIPAALERKADA